jgi:hypothetical protein
MKTDEDNQIAQMGISMLLPGAIHQAKLANAEVQRLQGLLAQLQNGNRVRRGKTASTSYWAKMTPEERSAEIIRRKAKSVAEQKPKRRISAAGRRAISAAQKARWAKQKTAEATRQTVAQLRRAKKGGAE